MTIQYDDNRRFPERILEHYVYDRMTPHGNGKLYFSFDDGEAVVWFEDGNRDDGYFQSCPYDTSDLEWWVAHVLWWYDIHEQLAWSVTDVRRAAQLCMYVGHVLNSDDLIHYCGIKDNFAAPPDDWETVKQRWNADKNPDMQPINEGAD
jgi:hypothetical protein